MRKFASYFFLVAVFSSAAYCQLPGGNVFVGYSYLGAEQVGSGRASLNGWNASGELKVFPFIGLVADFSGQYGSENLPSSFVCSGLAPCISLTSTTSVSQHNFLFGPRASFSVGKFRPFVHALIGASHISESGTGSNNSDTSFADALGGGLDYKLIPLISWRFQADALQTRFFGTTQNDFRFSTGVVFHF